MWKNLQIEEISPKAETTKYVTALKAVFKNGDVRFKIFEISHHPIFDWYLSRNQLYEMGFFQNFRPISI